MYFLQYVKNIFFLNIFIHTDFNFLYNIFLMKLFYIIYINYLADHSSFFGFFKLIKH